MRSQPNLICLFVLIDFGFSQNPLFAVPPPAATVAPPPVKPLERDLFQELSSLSPCQKGCSANLMESIDLVLKTMSHIQRYDMICKSYNQSYACIEKEKRCGNEDHKFFETITSGFHYMCVDQQLAFKNTIHCIDAQSTQVQMECENDCNTKNTIMNIVMRSSIAQGIQNQIFGGAPAADLNNPFNPATFQELTQMSGELCTVGDCVLKCIKNKFNSRCEGSAGTLLSEVFVRPIAEAQTQLGTLGPFLGIFLHQSCTYLHDGKSLQDSYRIDPTMDNELRRMYSQKEAEKNLPKNVPSKPPTPPAQKPPPTVAPNVPASPNLRIPPPLNGPASAQKPIVPSNSALPNVPNQQIFQMPRIPSPSRPSSPLFPSDIPKFPTPVKPSNLPIRESSINLPPSGSSNLPASRQIPSMDSTKETATGLPQIDEKVSERSPLQTTPVPPRIVANPSSIH